MLTAGAENALLKTLEEPPSHVTWVLATTEPHKVVQTIRSRCQVFELGLIPSDIMSDHVRYVVNDAELDVDDAAIDHAVAAGGGSARDTLTALERVVAGGETTDLDSSTDAILGALAEGDRAAALSAVGDAVGRGRDPRTIGEMVLAGLRDAFLTAMGDPPVRLSEHERARAADLASRMAPAAMTRALETLGRALIDMRQAPDPRVDIEVALVRLCHPDEDRSLEALAQRVQRLETRLDGLPASAPTAALPAPSRPAAPAAPAHQDEAAAPALASAAPAAAAARRALSEHRASAPAAPSAPAAAPVSATGPAAAARRALSEHRPRLLRRRLRPRPRRCPPVARPHRHRRCRCPIWRRCAPRARPRWWSWPARTWAWSGASWWPERLSWSRARSAGATPRSCRPCGGTSWSTRRRRARSRIRPCRRLRPMRPTRIGVRVCVGVGPRVGV